MACRSVAIVIEETPGESIDTPWFLLDARNLLLGWRSLPAPQGQFSCRDLIDSLVLELGPEWQLWLRHVPLDADFIRVRAGQVFIVDVPRHRTTAPMDATETSRPPDQGGGGNPAADTSSGTLVGAAAPLETQARHPNFAERGDDGEAPSDDNPGPPFGPVDTSREPVAYMDVPFLILLPNYAHEWVSVRLPVGVPITDALNAAARARHPSTAVRMPILCAVHPQPCDGIVLTAGMPVWHHPGAIIVIDSRAVNDRLFAIHITSPCRRHDLLHLAGISDDGIIEVFFRDLPWPLPATSHIDPTNGDLVVIRPGNAGIHFVSSLADMFLSSAGWRTCPEVEPNNSDAAWILGPSGPVTVRVPLQRQHRARHEIANCVGLPLNSVVITPAFGGVGDFVDRGDLMRNVVVARPMESPAGIRAPFCPVCILDVRPLLLQFDWVPCSEGIFDPTPIIDRFRHRCPPGYRLGRIVDGASFRTLDGPFLIQDGDVITLALRMDSSVGFADGPPAGGMDEDPSNAGEPSSGTGHVGDTSHGADTRLQGGYPSGTLPDTSTGPADAPESCCLEGINHLFTSDEQPRRLGPVDTWLWGLRRDALPESLPETTPVLTSCCVADIAVQSWALCVRTSPCPRLHGVALAVCDPSAYALPFGDLILGTQPSKALRIWNHWLC